MAIGQPRHDFGAGWRPPGGDLATFPHDGGAATSRTTHDPHETLARALGWFSIGLGVAQLVAPQGIARLIGVRGDHRTLTRLCGVRELASGIGILSQRRPAGWLWARAGGDVIDLALLGAAFTSRRARRGRLVAATAAVAGATALDVLVGQRLSATPRDGGRHPAPATGVHVTRAITVDRPPEDLYRFWRNFDQLPRVMRKVESVRTTGDGRSHWVARGPAGTRVEWDSEVVTDRPNELIAWRSLDGSTLQHAGSVRFAPAPAGRGTVVTVEMRYRPPGGTVGAMVARLFGQAPEQQLQEDLRRFKQLMETGEIPTTDGQPAGRTRSLIGR
jgi:uncharacterized membrane protein